MGITRILFVLALIYLGYRAVTIAGRIIFKIGKAAGKNEQSPPSSSDASKRIDPSDAHDADFEELEK